MNLIKNKNIKKPILDIKNNAGNNINESSINNSNYYNYKSIINKSKIYIRIKLSKKGIKIQDMYTI